MQQTDPAFMQPAKVPGVTGFVIVVGGAAAVVLLTRNTLGDGVTPVGIGLRRLECECVTGGIGGNFLITSSLQQGGGPTLTLIGGFFVEAPVAGGHLAIDFPVALKGNNSILIESSTGAGTWNITPNGYAA